MATDSQPLSLEDHCLLRLICHLEDFPPEVLARLSIPVRRRLLLNLPAVDVCQLEGTAVAEGINMELSVWKELLGHRHGSAVITKCSFKQQYFDRAYEYLLNGHGEVDRASRLLLSVRDCLGVNDWSNIHHSFATRDIQFCSPTPHRHVRGFTGEHLMVHLMSVVFHKCKCWPENLTINCNQFFESSSWDIRGIVFSSYLCPLFKQVKSVTFVEEEGIPAAFSIPQFFLEVLFARQQVSLTAFSLRGTYDFLRFALANSRLFFSPASSSSEDQYILQSLYPRVLPCVPYGGLVSIDIVGWEDLEEDESEPLQKDLESIVTYQNSLTSVHLDCFDFSTPICSVIFSLGSLFHQPQFLKLKLLNVTLGSKQLKILIRDFLASPTHQDDTKSLSVKGLNFVHIIPPEIPGCNGPFTMGPPGKALSLSITDDYDSSDVEGLFWLLSHYPCSQLRSFSFTADCYYKLSVEASAVMNLFAGPAQVLLETLKLESTSLLHSPSPEVPFRNVFSSPFLKTVSLCDCRIGKDRLLPALTQGLLQQVPFGDLQELRLDGNDLGDSDFADLEAFCDALFNLCTIPMLVLSIKRNRLKPLHFFLMYTTWKRNFSRVSERMKQLFVSGNEYEHHLAELQGIAASGDF